MAANRNGERADRGETFTRADIFLLIQQISRA